MGWALRVLAVGVGLYFVALGVNKLPWIFDSSLLLDRFDRWGANARPEVRWYLDTIAIPGVPVFARLVPVAELATGVALVSGLWPRIIAAAALFMVMNFHFASGDFSSWNFLRDPTGPPVLGGLLALAINPAKLPWTIRS